MRRHHMPTEVRKRGAGANGWTKLSIILSGLLLASCTLPGPSVPPAGEWPVAPRPELVELSHAVHFATDSDRLSPVELARLRRFVEGLPAGITGRVRVVGHADERGTQTYNLDLSARRARAVADALRDILGREVVVDTAGFGEAWPADPGHDDGAWARNRRAVVEVRVAMVRIDGCEPRTPATGYRMDNGPLPGLGCATARNLAAMIANPADLLSPGPLAPAPGYAAAAAVGRYREGKVTPLLDAWGGAP